MDTNEIKTKYPKTYENIMTAFAGESQARNKYDFFAKVSRKEGHQKLAEFFEETAKNEMEHAKLLFKLVNGIGSSKENLQECIDGENYETEEMYPEFKTIAQDEGFKGAELLFDKLAKIEKLHEERYKRLLTELEADSLYNSKSGEKIAWICQKCGNVHEGEKAPEVCPVCAHPKGYYEREQIQY
ncbi:MAG: rubrerythrin family protein [Candidatus Woesearchaeota archaeon]|jgi:rubrerythrin|nr:rubrerythrin family protein [Candidatus Woesearchaeota archaeon]